MHEWKSFAKGGAPARRRGLRRTACALMLAAAAAACGGSDADGPLVVFNAGSLARPMRAALDSFARREGVDVAQESAGSLESARKLTELGKIPDVIALADAEVFPRYLMPAHVGAYVEFARNRMVIAYTDRSKYADAMVPGTWWQVLRRDDVEVGRADPQLDPNGYRTLLVWQLAERHYRERGLEADLRANSPPRNVRPKEADLVGLLQAGEFDYIWSYESMARAAGLRYVTLPASVDLSDPALADFYATASVRVRGASVGDTVEFRGQPIVYAFAVPINAPHRALGERFAAFLLSDDGRAILREAGLDTTAEPRIRGAHEEWMSAGPVGAAGRDTSPQ